MSPIFYSVFLLNTHPVFKKMSIDPETNENNVLFVAFGAKF